MVDGLVGGWHGCLRMWGRACECGCTVGVTVGVVGTSMVVV